MPRMIFVNLPVESVSASTRFYEAIGCRKNEQFSSDQAASMAWSDVITFQLLARDYFATFTSKQICDARSTCQVLLCLSCESREQVDSLSGIAAANGGKAVRDAIDFGFLYNRAVEDPDGHVLELAWMNPESM